MQLGKMSLKLRTGKSFREVELLKFLAINYACQSEPEPQLNAEFTQ